MLVAEYRTYLNIHISRLENQSKAHTKKGYYAI